MLKNCKSVFLQPQKAIETVGEFDLVSQRLTGSRIREKRLDCGIRQTVLADTVGISASYLNLIEHNRRRIGGKLLHDLARALDVDASSLTEGANTDLLDQLHAAAATFGQSDDVARAEDLAARFPAWSQLIVAQSQRIDALEKQVQVLNDRMAHDPQLAESLHEVISTVTSIRSSASILAGQEILDVDWQRRFHQNIHDDSRRLAASSEALVKYLDAPQEETSAPLSPMEEVETYFAVSNYCFDALEGDRVDIGQWAKSANLSSPATKLLALAGRIYHSDASALPREQLIASARACNYDPVVLASEFDLSLEIVLRRLATLSTNDGHPPMGLAVCDSSGTLIYLKSVPGLTIPRTGGGCPHWPLFGAMSRPMQPIQAEVALPDTAGTRMLCYAIAVPQGPLAVDRPPALQSTMLVFPDTPPAAASPLKLGVSCRICPHRDCASRREPVIGGIMTNPGFDSFGKTRNSGQD